jgi:hypothetical protein
MELNACSEGQAQNSKALLLIIDSTRLKTSQAFFASDAISFINQVIFPEGFNCLIQIGFNIFNLQAHPHPEEPRHGLIE